MRSRRIRRGEIEEPPINLTPLIDVVFVILIMFILVAPLLELDRVELADASHQTLESNLAVQESSLTTIHVRSDNSLLFNNQKITLDQLPALLKQARQKYPQTRPQLYHDKRAYFGTYQAVKNAMEEAGFTEVDIILKPS
jgi:biopolymer transport protein ExbD